MNKDKKGLTYFDILIKNGKVIDGTGLPWFYSDIGIIGDTIVSLGKDLKKFKAKKIIDAKDMFVCPGFIDIHTHSELTPLIDPNRSCKLFQGITTELSGNCGIGIFPLNDRYRDDMKIYLTTLFGEYSEDWYWNSWDDYFDIIKDKTIINMCFLIPYMNLRVLYNGFKRDINKRNLELIKEKIAEGLEFGAAGVSFGLNFAPMCFAQKKELIDVCRVVSSYDKFFAIHLRNYHEEFFNALQEAIEICKKSGASMQLSHYHVSHPVNYGKAGIMIEIVENCRADELDITMDRYPSTVRGGAPLHGVLPSWLMEDGGLKKLLKDISKKEVRNKIEHDGGMEFVKNNLDNLIICGVRSEKNKFLLGKNLGEANQYYKKSIVDLICDLVLEEELGITVMTVAGNEDDLRELIKSDLMMICSDGIEYGDRLHPRVYGAFTKVIRKYVKEEGILKLEEAIKKMTYMPAKRIGICDRGIIDIDKKADIVILDYLKLADKATYDNPREVSEGILYVIVNGKVVLENSKINYTNAGEIIRITG